MERAQWLLLMNIRCKPLAMAGGFTRAREHLKERMIRPFRAAFAIDSTARADFIRSDAWSQLFAVYRFLIRKLRRQAVTQSL